MKTRLGPIGFSPNLNQTRAERISGVWTSVIVNNVDSWFTVVVAKHSKWEGPLLLKWLIGMRYFHQTPVCICRSSIWGQSTKSWGLATWWRYNITLKYNWQLKMGMRCFFPRCRDCLRTLAYLKPVLQWSLRTSKTIGMKLVELFWFMALEACEEFERNQPPSCFSGEMIVYYNIFHLCHTIEQLYLNNHYCQMNHCSLNIGDYWKKTNYIFAQP